MKPSKQSSLQDILRRRQREDFVGRESQISVFRRNLALPLDDERRRFLFNVFGQGGAGKTSLLRRFRQLAEAVESAVAWCDETQEDVPSVLGHLVEQLQKQGYEFRAFQERYRVYRQKRQELEADPEAPHGISSVVGRALAKTGVHFARRAPIVGVAFDFVDEEALASHIGDFATYVAKKIGNRGCINKDL